MTKNAETPKITATTMLTKHAQVVGLLSRTEGASLDEMSTLANWLTHSTRAFLSGLKKKGYAVTSDKTSGVRRYKIVKSA